MNENDPLMTVKAVAELVTFSARKIWRDVAAKLFPKPKKDGHSSLCALLRRKTMNRRKCGFIRNSCGK